MSNNRDFEVSDAIVAYLQYWFGWMLAVATGDLLGVSVSDPAEFWGLVTIGSLVIACVLAVIVIKGYVKREQS